MDQQYADTFVHSICNSSDIVIFSAAIPLMGGTHHVNKQWPSYWIEKFKIEGNLPLDCLHPVFWDNKNVMACYKQDMLRYVRQEKFNATKDLFSKEENHIYDIVHPDKYCKAKAADKLINRAWLRNHLPEKVFVLLKKIYLIFGDDKVV